MMAAAKANPNSLFLSSSSTPYSSFPPLHRISLNKLPFLPRSQCSNLISACSKKPISGSVNLDPSITSFGSGSTKVDSLDESAEVSSSPSNAIDFLTLCHSLKTQKRKGWVNHGIKGPESIADHMYLMSVMALIASDLPDVNRERCIKMAIVHDIAEAIVGDITPSDGVPKAEKSRREQAALNEMCKILGGGMRAEEIKELWQEYENNASLEANLVKDFDKVEMILQALEYESEHGKVLDEFFLSTAGKFQTEIGKSWAAEIHSRRNSRLEKRLN
nr:HD domain-containing protein 2 [Nicotiana tomentosiformis]XP_016515884.1 PREDICTED: HD domain-containing protein 2-like [Nicotiana tabacum]